MCDTQVERPVDDGPLFLDMAGPRRSSATGRARSRGAAVRSDRSGGTACCRIDRPPARRSSRHGMIRERLEGAVVQSSEAVLTTAGPTGTATVDRHAGRCADLGICWWALEDLNLRPLPCQGRPAQPSDQRFRSSGHLRRVTGVPSGTVCFGRLLDLVLTNTRHPAGGSSGGRSLVGSAVRWTWGQEHLFAGQREGESAMPSRHPPSSGCRTRALSAR